MKRSILVAVSLVVSTASIARAASPSDDIAAVLETVQKFFDTMNAKDVEGARAILDPEGSFVSVRPGDGEQVIRRASNAQYLDSLESGTRVSLERMWEPQVLIRGSIAIVWTEYDFHRDGELSHCGVDAFQLVKRGGTWIINGGTYTVEPTGCGDSPLGPPN